MTTEELVKEALVPIVDWINESVPDEDKFDSTNIKQHPYYDSKERYDYQTRLRVDYELAHVDDQIGIGELVSLCMVDDLVDLIENGDVDNHSDWLLKAMDGAKKRGKKPVKVAIAAAELFAERKDRKATTEYTLFIRLYVDWEK